MPSASAQTNCTIRTHPFYTKLRYETNVFDKLGLTSTSTHSVILIILTQNWKIMNLKSSDSVL